MRRAESPTFETLVRNHKMFSGRAICSFRCLGCSIKEVECQLTKNDESDIMTLSDTPIIFVCHASCCLGVLNHHPKPLKEQIVYMPTKRSRTCARASDYRGSDLSRFPISGRSRITPLMKQAGQAHIYPPICCNDQFVCSC